MSKKTYHVYATVIGGKYIGTVEVENAEEAEELGWDHPNACAVLCHQCAREISDPEIDKIEVEEDNE